MKKLIVLVLCSSGVGNAPLSMEEFYKRTKGALEKLPSLEMRMVLSCNRGGGEEFCRDFARKHSDVDVFLPSEVAGSGVVTDAGAGRYVEGLLYCSKLGDIVLEIDAEGAHDPRELGPLVEALVSGKRAAFSTRFADGGKDYYPFQRRLSSFAVTVLANMFLGLGRYVSDMTSGFEAFDSNLLKEIFEIHPTEQWITMRTTTALIQTELRACVLWLLQKQGRQVLYRDIAIFPIAYGKEKTGRNFPASVGKQALRGFFQLVRYRKQFMNKVRV